MLVEHLLGSNSLPFLEGRWLPFLRNHEGWTQLWWLESHQESLCIGNFVCINILKCHFKLLEKETQEPKILPTERFRFNSGYNEKRKKVALPFIFAEEIFKRGKTVLGILSLESIDPEREIAIEASIVKIMKARKQLPYTLLISETQALLKFFKPTTTIIKTRIEKLISLEYLARD